MLDWPSLPSSPVLSAKHCLDPDQIVGLLPGTKRRLLPLAGDFEYGEASLQLDGLRLVVVQRPPCSSEGYLEKDQTGIALAMTHSPGLKLDGLALDQPALVTHGLKSHRIFQPDELTIAAIFLRCGDSDRGWPERAATAQVHHIRIGPLARLRAMFRDILCLAVHDPVRFEQKSIVSGMQQSLLGTIDDAFLTASATMKSGLAVRRYVQICRLADEFIASHPRNTFTSSDIADAAGVTIRTLHNAMIAVRGMTLQRFMVLNRLWAVRAALSNDAATERVKTAAFDHGFWHLGRFARTYRTFFGEAPSETIARAKSVQRRCHEPGGQRR